MRVNVISFPDLHCSYLYAIVLLMIMINLTFTQSETILLLQPRPYQTQAYTLAFVLEAFQRDTQANTQFPTCNVSFWKNVFIYECPHIYTHTACPSAWEKAVPLDL